MPFHFVTSSLRYFFPLLQVLTLVTAAIASGSSIIAGRNTLTIGGSPGTVIVVPTSVKANAPSVMGLAIKLCVSMFAGSFRKKHGSVISKLRKLQTSAEMRPNRMRSKVSTRR